MDRSAIESAVIVIVFAAAFVLGHLLEPGRLNRRHVQGTAHIIKEDRLPFRFSLRTLLIATTLFAVALGLGVWLAS